MNDEMELQEFLLELLRTKQFVKLKETLNDVNPVNFPFQQVFCKNGLCIQAKDHSLI